MRDGNRQESTELSWVGIRSGMNIVQSFIVTDSSSSSRVSGIGCRLGHCWILLPARRSFFYTARNISKNHFTGGIFLTPLTNAAQQYGVYAATDFVVLGATMFPSNVWHLNPESGFSASPAFGTVNSFFSAALTILVWLLSCRVRDAQREASSPHWPLCHSL